MARTPRHPSVPGCVVRLTEDAVADLDDLFSKDPSIVRRCLKKLIVIERDPRAGEPLLGGLIGYRKIAVGRNDWRIVWKVTGDQVGGYLVEVAEIWAVGYRKDGDVYEEIADRLESASTSPVTRALSDVLSIFVQQAQGIAALTEPTEPEPTPGWLRQALIHVVGLGAEQVDEMSADAAHRTWEAYTTASDNS